MTTDEKIDGVFELVQAQGKQLGEVTRLVQAQGKELGEVTRLVQVQGKELGEVTRLVQAQGKELGELSKLVQTQGDQSRARDDELLSLILQERKMNSLRYDQHATTLTSLTKEVREMKADMAKMNADLNAKVDKVYDSLSHDIQVFGNDLHQVKRRVTKLEKKLANHL